MIGHIFRVAAYKRQTGSQSLTCAQRKRSQKKLGHYLAKKNVVGIRSVKGKASK